MKLKIIRAKQNHQPTSPPHNQRTRSGNVQRNFPGCLRGVQQSEIVWLAARLYIKYVFWTNYSWIFSLLSAVPLIGQQLLLTASNLILWATESVGVLHQALHLSTWTGTNGQLYMSHDTPNTPLVNILKDYSTVGCKMFIYQCTLKKTSPWTIWTEYCLLLINMCKGDARDARPCAEPPGWL